ncbi:CAP domain-containing protein [Candidatus Nitrosocosmicus sp. R]
MNQINISLIFLIMISMVLPASAIMYVSGSTVDNSDASDSGFSENSFASDSGSTEDNSDASDSGSTDNDGTFPITSTESSDALPIDPTVINSTGNEQLQDVDLENTILNIHNQERAAVNVPALSWSSSLASNAQSWADQLLAQGKFEHSPDTSYGENIAQLSRINSNPNEIDLSKMVQTWVDEKNSYDGQPITNDNFMQFGHYTQMVWKSTTEVGCGMASDTGKDILVCQYTPSGNQIGQSAY